MVSRVCEEFGLAPSQAQRELDEDDGLILEIIELRDFARAKQHIDAATAAGRELETLSPMQKRVMRLEYDLGKERRAAAT